MADKKITDLTAITVMATGDVIEMVSDPSGSPLSKKITRANFMGGTNITQVVGTTETQTLTNKTLTLPVIASISNTGTLTLPTSSDTLVGKATTDTLTNKTFDTAGTGNVLKINGTTVSAKTGTGSVVLATTPTLVTPVLGVATATSYNGLTLTATTGTFTLTNAKTLTVSDSTTLATNAITLGGGEVITFSASNALSLLTTGTSVMTFPTATDTVAVLGTAQTYTATLTEKQVVYSNNAITASANAATVPITSKLNTVTNNSAATLTITMTTASAVDGQTSIVRILDFSGVAQTIAWVNTENSTVSAPTTSNGSTTLFLTVGFIYNGSTSKWRCIASA